MKGNAINTKCQLCHYGESHFSFFSVTVYQMYFSKLYA